MHRYLRAWRNHRGLSQEQVGNILQKSYTTIGRWENGKVPLTSDDMSKLAKIYQVSLSQLQMPLEEAETVSRLERVQAIIEGMPEEALAHWLALGQALRKP